MPHALGCRECLGSGRTQQQTRQSAARARAQRRDPRDGARLSLRIQLPLPRPRIQLPGGARRRAQAEGDLIYPRRRLPGPEMKHGPIALIDQFMPVVFIAMKDRTYDKVVSNIEEVVARQGSVIAITDDDNCELDDLCEYVIRIPRVKEFLSPLLTVVPLQLLSYHIAVMRGCHVDQPRNLAKSVTVE